MHILYGLGIPLLMLNPEAIFQRYKPKLFFRIFITALFIIEKKMNMLLNLRCWMKKFQLVYNGLSL